MVMMMVTLMIHLLLSTIRQHQQNPINQKPFLEKRFRNTEQCEVEVGFIRKKKQNKEAYIYMVYLILVEQILVADQLRSRRLCLESGLSSL